MAWQDMSRTYHKIKRIPISTFNARGKDYLTPEETERLLSGIVVIEEKLDGKTEGKRYKTLTYWYEDLRIRHTIPYTHGYKKYVHSTGINSRLEACL